MPQSSIRNGWRNVKSGKGALSAHDGSDSFARLGNDEEWMAVKRLGNVDVGLKDVRKV